MGSMSTRKILQSQWTSLFMCTKCSPFSAIIRQFLNFKDSRGKNCVLQQQRHYSSKSPINSSLVPATLASNTSIESPSSPSSTIPMVPIFSSYDIRELDPDTRIKIHSASVEVAKAQASSLLANKRIRRRKEILIMDESEYADKHVLKKKASLLDRRGEAQSHLMRSLEPDDFNSTDIMCTLHADLDLRPAAIKKWRAKQKVEHAILLQGYNPMRTKMLGNDLAAAHVIVARGGKVKFMGHKLWVTEYRKDAEPGVPEEDLPVMALELCTLPVNYDPRYRLEAIDASGVDLHYEGLENFENLEYVKWLSLRDSPYIDDWCLDRIARQLGDSLEFIDLSGCKNVTDNGIGALHRCSQLKAVVVQNMDHLENLEIVSAMLEDYNPNIEVIGIDYESKTEQLRLEGEQLELEIQDNKQIDANMNTVLSLTPSSEDKQEETSEERNSIKSATTTHSQ